LNHPPIYRKLLLPGKPGGTRGWAGTKAVLSLILLGLGAANTAQAQADARPAPVPHKSIVYFGANGQILPSAEGAEHREEITFRDSVSGTVRIYFSSGKIRRIVPYAHLTQGIEHGVETTWYETGQMQTREEYVAGQREGQLLAYYPTGILKRRETYAGGQRTAGELFGPDGQPRAFAEEQELPVYPGPESALAQDLSRAVRYPTAALNKRVQGTVFVNFTVNQTGLVQDAQVAKSDSPLLNAAALAAVRKLKPFRPGRKDGEPVSTPYTIPVKFTLRGLTTSPLDAIDNTRRAAQYEQQVILRPAVNSQQPTRNAVRP
jgi:protein TonB